MFKVKHERTCDCVVAGFRMHKDGKGVGSLLLGLYDDERRRCTTSASRARWRRAAASSCSKSVEPLRKNALEEHPWREWADAVSQAAESGQRMPGGPNRWNATKDMSWEPLRIERVCEVAYEGSQRALPPQRTSATGVTTRIPTTAPTVSSRSSSRPSCSRCSASRPVARDLPPGVSARRCVEPG